MAGIGNTSTFINHSDHPGVHLPQGNSSTDDIALLGDQSRKLQNADAVCYPEIRTSKLKKKRAGITSNRNVQNSG